MLTVAPEKKRSLRKKERNFLREETKSNLRAIKWVKGKNVGGKTSSKFLFNFPLEWMRNTKLSVN